MSRLILQHIETQPIYQPLQLFSEHLHEWHELRITPNAVVAALGNMAGRELKPFEQRDAIDWLEVGIIGRIARQGEI